MKRRLTTEPREQYGAGAEAHELLLRLLRLWLDSSEGDALPVPVREAPTAVAQAVTAARLAPFFGRWCFAESELADWLEECRAAYLVNVAVAEGRLREGCRLCALLEESGVACLPMKGPFAGHVLYGDCAVRQSMDMDLLVMPEQAEQAASLLREEGYRLRKNGPSAGFSRRHHLHWSLHQAEKNQWLDLHWRLDHPFSLQRMDVTELFVESHWVEWNGCRWRWPEANRHLLMLCAQLWKECAGGRSRSAGGLRAALDLAVLLRRTGKEPDAAWLLNTAARWRMMESLHFASDTLRELLGETPSLFQWLEKFPMVGKNRLSHGAEIFMEEKRGAFERAGVFRSERLPEVLRYVWPPRDWFDGPAGAGLLLRRTAHAGRAGLRVTSAALELTAELCRHRLRRIVR